MFDIDKIFISRLNYRYDEATKEITTIYDENKNPNKYHQNKLLKSYIGILNSPSNAHLKLRSIDNDTELLHNVIKELELNDIEDEQVSPYDFYCLRYQCMTKNNFITGKNGIGPFALNNNNQILTLLYNVSFASDSFMRKIGFGSLHLKNDKDQNNILSWISALINAHVDIAKDPYITKLNVGPFTYNLVNLLIRTGLGKNTFYFTCSQIIKDLAVADKNATGSFMSEKGMSPYRRKQLAEKELIDKKFPPFVKLRINKLFLPTKKGGMGYDLHNITAHILSHDFCFDAEGNRMESNILKNLIKSKKDKYDHLVMFTIPTNISNNSLDGKIKDASSSILVSPLELLYLVYLTYKQLNPYSEALSSLVKYSKIDTKKQGKTIAEQLVFLAGVNDIFDNGSLGNMFEQDGLHDMYTKSYIYKKTYNAINTFLKTLSNQVFEATPLMRSIIENRLLPAIGQNIILTDQKYKKYQNAIKAAVKSKFFNQYCELNSINIKGLVSGDNTIYDRLNKIKADILSGKYPLLLLNGEINNTLLKLLLSTDRWLYNPKLHREQNGSTETYPILKFIRLFENMDLSVSKKNYIIQAWDDLLHDNTYPEIRDFARDLAVYSFYTHVDNGGIMDLFKYVPNSFKNESGYTKFIREQLANFNNENTDVAQYQDLVEDVILNNWNDYDFIETVELQSKNTDGSVVINYLPYYGEMMYNGALIGEKNFPVLLRKTEVDNQPSLFIKTSRETKDQGSKKQYSVYKLLTIDLNGHPIYYKVTPKSVFYKQFAFREYGRSDSDENVEYAPNQEKLLLFVDSLLKASKTDDEFLKSLHNYGGSRFEEIFGEVGNDLHNNPYSFITKVEQPQVSTDINNMSDITLHSGGAHGADTVWDIIGREYGITEVKHYRDANNTKLSSRLIKNEVQAEVLTEEQLKYAKLQIKDLLGIDLSDTIGDNLKARNYYQVANADAVFAIASFANNATPATENALISQHVRGGTDVAVQLGIAISKPVYVFDIESEQWTVYDPNAVSEGVGGFISCDTPVLTKNFAGVGTRNIEDYSIFNKETGKWEPRKQYVGLEKEKIATQAIRDVYEKTRQSIYYGDEVNLSESTTDIATSTGQQTYNESFDDSDFSDEAMNYCKGN